MAEALALLDGVVMGHPMGRTERDRVAALIRILDHQLHSASARAASASKEEAGKLHDAERELAHHKELCQHKTAELLHKSLELSHMSKELVQTQEQHHAVRHFLSPALVMRNRLLILFCVFGSCSAV